jgi:hypothetical protein
MFHSVAITQKTEEPAMNKQLSADEVANLSVPIPIVEPMTRQAKLQRLADIARKNFPTRIYHQLEHYPDEAYDEMGTTGSVFHLAKNDPVLRAAGYVGETLGDAKRFFELTRHDLHEFSCDCGGEVTNQDMADRIEKIAGRVPQIVIDSKSWTG